MARRGGKNKTGRKSGRGSAHKATTATAVSNDTKSQNENTDSQSRRQNPLIAFVGQLSFDTTREDLMNHIKTQLADGHHHKVTDKTLKIRMLTDKKTKQSRGMAFVEVLNGDPEFLYALLKLHQTYLKGRRINIERSAGGRKNSENRKTKLEQYKKEQQEYFAEVVDNILKEFKTTGEIRDDELDDGVIQLCRHHAGPVVRAAITEYVEKGGRDMDNPSAYLTFLVAKFAKEGIHDEEATGKTKKNRKDIPSSTSSRKRQADDHGDDASQTKRSREWKDSSSLAKSGVNMSLSDSKAPGLSPTKDLSKIFPSSTRGKGRGYMKNVRSR